MKTINTLILFITSTIIFSCNTNTNSVDEKENNLIQEDISIKNKKKNDKYVGRWKNIDKSEEIISIEKHYDNVYSIGGLTVTKEYAMDGSEYLAGTSEEQGVEYQIIYDEYTEHLIFRLPFNITFEYERIN